MHKKNYYTKIFYSSLSTRFCCKWSSEKDFKLISVFYLYYFCYETNFSIHFCLLYFCRWNCRVRSKKKEFSGLKLLCWKSWSRKAPLRFSLKYLLSKFVRYHSVSSLAIHKSFLAMDQAFVKKKKKKHIYRCFTNDQYLFYRYSWQKLEGTSKEHWVQLLPLLKTT